jgi:polyvinyl alcohol dehydrogenase (cytochrome)
MSVRRIVHSLDTGTMMMPGRRVTPEGRRAIAEYLTGKVLRDEAPRPLAGLCGSDVQSRGTASWTGWSPDPANSRHQPKPGLAVGDLGRLKLRWAFGFEDDVVAFAQPALHNGRVYTGSAGGGVYALDAATGCTHWRFDADTGVRTAPVIANGLLYVGDLQSNLYALKIGTGELAWRRRIDPHPVARLTAAPALHGGTLYVAVSSFEEGMGSDGTYECCTFRGSVAAVDAKTGRELWRTYMIDRPAKPTRKNKLGTQLRGPSGVAIWSTPTVDVKRGVVYVTTGDNYTDPATELSDAVIALRLRDGAIAWANQLTPNDVWNAACMGDKINCPDPEGPDADFGSSAVLARTPAGRELLIAAQKSGVVYALDPNRKGRVLWQTRAGKGGLLGGIQWGHAVDERQVYAPISDMVIPEAATTGGGIVALRIDDGKEAWRAEPVKCGDKKPCSPAQMAAATAIPGVVFSGARDGVMRAYSSEKGKVLWSFDTVRDFETVNNVAARGGAIDGPGPVIADGMLLFTSGYAYWNGMPGNVLLAFTAE